MKRLLISLLLVLMFATTASAYPVGDLNEDWAVNIADLRLLAADWLDTLDCFGASGCADLDDDHTASIPDLALLAENWFLTPAPTLVINEFMASNGAGTGLEDPDEPGEYPDWIEIYNYGTGTVNMAGMQLNDSSNTYIIPGGVSIAAGEYKIFYADDDDEQGPLHTNYKLSANGDAIYLAGIDSKVYTDTQLTDYSSGRYPDNTADWYTMETSTPGATNQAGIADRVWFSKLSGTFTSTFNLELSTESPTAEIRYTINGSLPTASSTLYSGPILIGNSAARRVRARVYDSPLAPGPIQSHYYVPLESNVQAFKSNLPIVIIETYGVGIGQDYASALTTFINTDKDTGLASITDVPDFAGRAGMKIRGESSQGFPKKQYAVELWDETGNWNELGIDTKASILSMPSESDWILQAPYGDKTLLRNVLAFKWANDIGKGFAAPGTQFVEVFLNEWGGNCSYADYNGVYVLTEKIKVGDNRVDIAKLDPTDTTEPDISGGYMLRVDKNLNNTEFEFFTLSPNMVGDIQYYDPDDFDLIGTQKTWIQAWLDQFQTDLNASDFNDPDAGYAQHIDVESFIETDLILEIFKDADGLKLSTYFHKERNGKLTFGPQWDRNFSSGNTWLHKDMPSSWGTYGWSYPPYWSQTTTTDEQWFNDDCSVYGWHNRLMFDADYKLRTADKWFEHREDKLSDAQISADINAFYNLLKTDETFSGGPNNAADRNFTKWNILNSLELCNYYYGNNPQLESYYIDTDGWSIVTPPIPSEDREQQNMSHTYHMETEWIKNWFNGQGTPTSPEWYKDEHSDRVGKLDLLWRDNRGIDAPPTLLVNSSPMNTGGNVTPGSTLTMTSSAGTIYYTTDGTDPREWTHWVTGTAGTSPFITMLVPESATKAVLVPTASVNENWKGGGAFTDSGWTDFTEVGGRNGGVGYEATSGYEDYLTYDLLGIMNDVNPTCYIRTSFSVDSGDLADMEYLTLRMRFDDAFIAYINGTEVASSSLAPASPAWDSAATNYIPDDSVAFTDYDITAYSGLLHSGVGNILAVHGLNSGAGSSDMLISYELEAGATGSGTGDSLVTGGTAVGTVYSGGITLNTTKQINARAKSGSNWTALNKANFSMNNVASSLRITELMYHPEDPNDEFIEFKNIGPASIDVALCELTKGVDFTFPSIVLAPNDYVIAVRNLAEFNARYPGYSGTIAGQYIKDKLDNGGENIRLKDAAGAIIQEFEYEDNWFPITDGEGFSLNIINPNDGNLDNWNKRLSWQASNVKDGTPGANHIANAVDNDVVVINEILIHTDDLVYGDWIELRNTTGSSVNIGNWYLSDDIKNLKRYKIASGTTIAAGGYKVFTSASDLPFGLSEHGESVYLTSGNGFDISGGYSVGEDFGAANNGDSIGRYTKGAPTFNTDFVQMTGQTRGYANAATPYVPGIVITEIMYNARDIQDLLGEYIELYNRSGSTVDLYHDTYTANTWKFTKGIEFEFPTGVSIASGQRILVSRANPQAFIKANGNPGVTVYGPFKDYTELANDGEKIELSMPGAPEPGTGYVPYIRVEQVNYSDGIHPLGDDPWPTDADARGDSLHRDSISSYSNDVDNWSAAPPTPGS